MQGEQVNPQVRQTADHQQASKIVEELSIKDLPSPFLSSCESDSNLLEDSVIYRLTCHINL